MAAYPKFACLLLFTVQSYSIDKFGLGHADFWGNCATA